MKFPLVKKSKVKYYTTLMALSIGGEFGSELYGRKYYLVKYEDDSELIFLTTNEPDSYFNEQALDDEFTLVKNFEQLVKDFENTELIGIVIDAGFKSPPKYIYYNIITINNSLKNLMLNHLEESISGYTDIDFKENEINQIKIWKNYLTK